MKKREFNKLLKKITTKEKLDIKKIPTLTDDERSGMVYFIIRNRKQVVKELIPEGFDLSWLHCMGYMYETTGKNGYTFIHNSEQKIR
jgi:hypothetical protein